MTAELGWKAVRVRRPNGYWDDVTNVRQELHDFIAAADLPTGATRESLMGRGYGQIASDRGVIDVQVAVQFAWAASSLHWIES